MGIKAYKGRAGVILGSDMSRTETKWTAEGDVAYREQTRTEGQKIYVDDKRRIALCMSGVYDPFYTDFLSKVLDGDINVKKAVKQGFFPELRDLNFSRWGGRVPNSEQINALLLATRFDKPKLFTCFPLGKVEERDWTSIGSGSQYALRYISEQSRLIPRRINLGEGIDIAVGSLDRASQDVYTGGLDLVVLTKDNIQEFGREIRKEIDDARVKALEKVKAHF